MYFSQMPRLSVLTLVLILANAVSQANAEVFRYRYVNLDQIVVPEGYMFFSPFGGLDDRGRLFGTLYDEFFTKFEIAYYQHGKFVKTGAPNTEALQVNNKSSVLAWFPDNPLTRLRIYRGNQFKEVITDSLFIKPLWLNDRDEVLFSDPLLGNFFSGHEGFILFKKGVLTEGKFQLPPGKKAYFSNDVIGFCSCDKSPLMNRFGEISGTLSGTYPLDFREETQAFRHHADTGKTQVLNHLPGDRFAWGGTINNKGNVLGYSFRFSPSYVEHVGVWDRQGRFKTYYTTDDVFNSSNMLVFNDNNVIAVSNIHPSRSGGIVI